VPTLRERLFPLLQIASLAVGVALAVFAYRDLLTFAPHLEIPDPVERMLFEPTDTTPAAILALTLWLCWRRSERWRRLPSERGPLGVTLLLLAVGAASLVWSRLTGADDLLVPSLIATGLGLASLAKGLPGVRLLWLPAVFLLFALPLPPALSNALIFRFQLWTAALAGQLLFLFGIPAHVAGATILRPDYTFHVIEACSGLRSVLTLSMLALLMVDLFRRRGAHAVLVVLAAPVVAFALNAVRAIALILNPHSAIATVHVAQGIAILLCGVLVLYVLDGVLARLLPEPPEAAPEGEPVARPLDPARKGLALAFLALLAVASVAIAPWGFAERPPADFETRLKRPFADWLVEPIEIDRVFLGSVSFRERYAARFQQDGDSVELFLGVGFRGRRYSSPLSPKTELLGSGWVIEERWPLDDVPGRTASEGLLLRSGTRWLLVEHWVDASGGVAAEAARSLLKLDSTPWRQPTDPIVVRIATPLSEPGPQERAAAQERLRRFRASLEPVIESVLGEMRP